MLQHAAFDLPSANEFLGKQLAVVLEAFRQRGREVLGLGTLLTPTDDPWRAGLMKIGRPSVFTNSSKDGVSPV
jgi:hypothetical protein